MSRPNRKPYIRGRLASQVIAGDLPGLAGRYVWERPIVAAVRTAWRSRSPGMPRPVAAHWLIKAGAA